MPPKAAKGPSKQKGQEEQREATLQAVVLTDSYDRGFSPFAQEKPRCLLPVANVVLIEYTLEFLANAGIRDIYLYVGAHEEQVEDYIK
ncbi:MAG: hypothetical protein LQ340_005438 [Diploschistes diacapsis]|nr:MAG: hypothetical protein LQ340_005438 [Diploschistes diacapsis]